MQCLFISKYRRIFSGVSAVSIMLGFLSSATSANSAELPLVIKGRYDGKNTIYWKIRQISVSPLFDQPETTAIEFYIQKPDKMYITMLNKMVYAKGDTIWVYLPEQKQVQKQIGDHVFNPFDLVDNSQKYYKVISSGKNSIHLKSIDETNEPESLDVGYLSDGRLSSASYFDINGTRVILEFAKESFVNKIPAKVFLKNLPKDVQVIDLNEP
jgi:outer membrane lipoprotein-sorting protein